MSAERGEWWAKMRQGPRVAMGSQGLSEWGKRPRRRRRFSASTEQVSRGRHPSRVRRSAAHGVPRLVLGETSDSQWASFRVRRTVPWQDIEHSFAA